MTKTARDSWPGKVVLVNGGSSGFGWFIASAFAGRGAKVFVNGREEARLQQAVHRIREDGVDCSKVPIQKLSAWGPRRKEFIDLLGRMRSGLSILRDDNCADNFKKTFTREEIGEKITKERVTTSAFQYVNSVAFQSFLC